MPDGWDTGGRTVHSIAMAVKKAPNATAFCCTTKDSAGQHGQRPQFRPEREVVDYSLTRNKRSVWTVPTVAYSEAHYATYPPRLITPPILASTSAKGCCSQCGKPWSAWWRKPMMVNPAHWAADLTPAKPVNARARHGHRAKGERYLKQPTDRWQPPASANREPRTAN